jgi:tRNA threonylcarbamoyladenosine biosynthesis protein TsaB
MLVLGVDSATPVASAALADENGLIGEILLNVGLTHSEQLLPMIDSLLSQCRRAIGDVTAIGVSSGPGSFTGLRIGMATAKALAQGISAVSKATGKAGAEVVAIPTLEAMAWQMAGQQVLTSPMLNARRGQIYTGLYHWRKTEADGADFTPAGSGETLSEIFASRQRGKKDRLPATANDGGWTLECLTPSEAAEPETWARRLNEVLDEGKESVYLLGDGAAMYKEIWDVDLGGRAVILPPLHGLCRGSFVALAAINKMIGNEADMGGDFYGMKPVYLRGI